MQTNIVKNPMYKTRIGTDVLFELPMGSASFDGVYDVATRFVQEHQSKNETLWQTFTEQFRLQKDSEDGGWNGEFWGKMMRGACRVYAYTQDKALYEILRRSVEDLLSAQEANGRFSTYKQDKEFGYWDMWCRKYVLLGMLFFSDICEDEALKARILTALRGHLDYIIARIGEGEGQIDILEATTHNDWTWGALNSSSILEPTVLMYNLTKDQKYLDFAAYLVRRGGSKWGNIYELALAGEKAPFEYPVKKAYEATSYFEGVLEYYRTTGDENAKTAFLNFISRVLETDFTLIGCAGTLHELFDHSSIMQTEYNDEVKQETCVTVTLMKAFYQALCLTGEAKYADAMERAGYNAMLGSINFGKNTTLPSDGECCNLYGYDKVFPFIELIGGYTFDAYAPLYKDKRNRRVGGFRRMDGGRAYGCCACIGGAGVALMPISAVLGAKDGLVINHLMQGSVCFGDWRLSIETAYPYGEDAVIRVLSAPKATNMLSLRIPAFAARSMTVNGTLAVDGGKGYVCLTNAAEVGMEFVVRIPRALVLHTLNGKHALTHGAITLALDERNQDLDVKITGEIVKATPMEAGFAAREALAVTFSDGQTLKFVDFASAGADYGNKKSRLSVWIDG